MQLSWSCENLLLFQWPDIQIYWIDCRRKCLCSVLQSGLGKGRTEE